MACGLKPLAPEMPAAPATRLRVLACSPRAGGNSDTAARLIGAAGGHCALRRPDKRRAAF